MKRIFSGMQPTNRLHIGNYLGALKNWVKLQQDGVETIYCAVDLHAITMPYERDELIKNTREVCAAYVAAGVDPKKSIIFAQSAVNVHAQLGWLLGTMAQVGKLDRMTQFKDKGGSNREKVGLGLYSYPVLMAADILAYQATHVPVGDDQAQHLELTRELARTYNHRYQTNFFPEPETVLVKGVTRVMSLKDASKKMSKSDASDASRINLSDDADTIASKLRKATSDPHPLPSDEAGLEGRAEATNLVNIYAALADVTAADVLKQFGGQQWSVFKAALADCAVERLKPIAGKFNRLMADTAAIDAILKDGAEKANAIAQPVLKQVMDTMGFWKVG